MTSRELSIYFTISYILPLEDLLDMLNLLNKHVKIIVNDLNLMNEKREWIDVSVSSFEQLLNEIESIDRNGWRMIVINNSTSDLLKIVFSKIDNSMYSIGITIPEKLNTKETENLPVLGLSIFSLILFNRKKIVMAYYGGNYANIYSEKLSFEETISINFFPSWLQYFGKEELENQGGIDALEANSLLKTSRIHDGLLIQIGDGPYDAFTPEGEELLVKATRSLPPVKK
ncbi:hypothetical protein QNI16_20850 [Cytophagaceae bacterium YF14B1]|uniref:Uncharacterized protein n=1 Tax=Xanthocytophaga flava TaxID=3048013 RepID=A0AAE3QUD8_9BACT|nr:hypothetical protein [Xanthocytophaga flavus]MDJ1482964.1 hypothetical protein [Xanthocytophaga flavus]